MKSPLAWVAIVVTAILAQAESTVPVNLALRKTCLQFHEASGGKANRAVDGNKNTNYFSYSCTHTSANAGDTVNNNWWAVDLVDISLIQKVVLYNRGDCCGSRLGNFDIVVTYTRPTPGTRLVFSSSEVCAHKTGAVSQGQSQTFNCNKQLQGRYVAVVRSRSQALTLCEVEVFGTPIPPCSLGLKFDESTKKCVDPCPDYQQRWDGTRCVVRCIASQKWVGTKCVAKCPSPQKYNTMFGTCEAKTCRCFASGDPHYYQYDGHRIDFMGKCKYTFTKLKDDFKNDKCYFNVEEKNVHIGNPRVSFVALLDVTVEDMTFRYSQQAGKVFIDGVDRTKSSFPITIRTRKGTDVKVSFANRQFQVEATACGMITTYRRYFIETFISSTLGTKVEGICGTCNDNRNDDLIAKGQTKATTKNEFSSSWSVPDDSGLQQQSNCKAADVNGDCTVAWATKVKNNNHCGYITDTNGPFKACIASGLVNVKQYQDSCEFDVCFYSKEATAAKDVPDVVCKNLAVFADDCAKQGLGSVWRRANFCPLNCEANASYTPKLYPACEKTCQQRKAPADCVAGEPEDGCSCNEGYFRLGNDCVLPGKCGCDAVDGQHIDSGNSVVMKGCTVKYECTAQGTLRQLAFPACHKDASCSTVNGQYACKCNDGFNGDGHSCQTNCPKAEEKWDTKNSKCVLRCAADYKWDEAKKDCIARCPAEKKWTVNKCVDRCPNAAEQWSQVEKKCILRCPDAATMWDTRQGKCVDRCEKHKEWDNKGKKCTDRCAAADKWDETQKQCIARCPADKEWKGAKCMDRCTDPATVWFNEKKACILRCPDAKTKWDEKQGKCVNRCSIAQLWEDTSKKCVERCVPADKWNEASKKCEPRCQVDQLWKMDKCVNRCGTGEKWHGATNKCYQDPMYPTTTEGNAGGAGCVIPFLFGGKWQEDCVPGANNKKWCGTTENYDQDKKWGYCSAACRTSAGLVKMAGDAWTEGKEKVFCNTDGSIGKITGENINTKASGKCVFPFKYNGKYYGGCTGSNPWCATTPDYDTDAKWGYCHLIATCLTQDHKQVTAGETWSSGGMEYSCGRDGKVRKNVKTSAGNCLFPFNYKGSTYEACTEVASAGKPWCYVDASESAYGYC
ncbi:zonadhesin-like [Lineus longissimus]|uniref:zonadhesin-like n=1 Tax=Lineus longissimus TaxID=88925 RepID=UPI00315D8313